MDKFDLLRACDGSLSARTIHKRQELHGHVGKSSNPVFPRGKNGSKIILGSWNGIGMAPALAWNGVAWRSGLALELG